jgi:hypothetical protein
MNARTLLVTGLGLLVLGLLLVLGMDNPATSSSQQAVLLQGYLTNLCSLVGSGLVVVAGLASALRKPEPRAAQQPPALDHYS